MKLDEMAIILPLVFFSCGNTNKQIDNNVSWGMSVDIETLVEDASINVRAIEIIDSIGFAYSTSNGKLGFYKAEGLDQSEDLTDVLMVQLRYDSIVPNFRTLAVTSNSCFGITVGSPALMFRMDFEEEKNKVVYKDFHEKAFYDSMEFWNDQEGIAIGDPTDDCMSIIITRDGGNSWAKLSCDDLPNAKDGEAAFAASDTNIAIVGDNTWVATGGKVSRILYSPDKGSTWEVFDTPIIQGSETTGMYSIDFYDDKNGFAIGGDYTKPADSSANKIRTKDGGKTWQVVAENQSPGYRSCVQYVPNTDAKALVTVGFKGIDYSSDAGDSWQHLSDDGFYTLRFLNDSVAFAGGNGRIAKLTFERNFK